MATQSSWFGDLGQTLRGWSRQVPLWLLLLLLSIGGAALYVARSPNSQVIFNTLSRGFALTIQISLVSYVLALIIGFVVGLGRVSKQPVIQAIATFYTELMRGVPILVIILYVAFVITPIIGVRSSFWRVVVALALSYGAYLAEVYRAGIQSVGRGQWEASRALGLSPRQTLGLVVMPQALRTILPPLGNDFIALLKDSSLATILGVGELTQQTRFYVSRSFDTFGGWTMAALLYLSLTLSLSLLVRLIEHLTSVKER